MVNRIVWRVGSPAALDFWADRLGGEGVETERENGSLVFSDPEGLEHELSTFEVPDEPLIAHSAEVPDEHALQGFEAVRAYTHDPAASRHLLADALAFDERSEAREWEARGEKRGGRILYDPSSQRGVPGAGTVHHVAWGIELGREDEWRERVIAAGAHPTPVIDRFYFHSIYFREPSGVLFEIADDGPGFTVDGPVEELGSKIILPPFLEDRREEIEARLTPLPDPRGEAVS